MVIANLLSCARRGGGLPRGITGRGGMRNRGPVQSRLAVLVPPWPATLQASRTGPSTVGTRQRTLLLPHLEDPHSPAVPPAQTPPPPIPDTPRRPGPHRRIPALPWTEHAVPAPCSPLPPPCPSWGGCRTLPAPAPLTADRPPPHYAAPQDPTCCHPSAFQDLLHHRPPEGGCVGQPSLPGLRGGCSWGATPGPCSCLGSFEGGTTHLKHP